MSSTHVYFTKTSSAPVVIAELPLDTFVYRVTSTRRSSKQLGPCQVCREWTSEMFRQEEAVTYDNDGKVDLTLHECQSLYGHEACLIGRRR